MADAKPNLPSQPCSLASSSAPHPPYRPLVLALDPEPTVPGKPLIRRKKRTGARRPGTDPSKDSRCSDDPATPGYATRSYG